MNIPNFDQDTATTLHGMHAFLACNHSAIAGIVMAVPHIFAGLATNMAPANHRSLIIFAHGNAVTTIKDKQSSVPMAGAHGIAVMLDTPAKFANILETFFLEHGTNKLTSLSKIKSKSNPMYGSAWQFLFRKPNKPLHAKEQRIPPVQ